MAVSVVTLLVDPEQSERLTLASTEGKIQLALRNPLDQTAPATPGIRPASLLGAVKPVAPAGRSARPSRPEPVTVAAVAPEPVPTVEIIRGDKRAEEVVR
jgi:pilus assembly protein CpaB